ncbi:hypothetical protein DW796_04515 [Collinsella sp. AM31-2AC]|nr:hypothetical protein DW796_04515 [Collinsella sp. AM31-2AC]
MFRLEVIAPVVERKVKLEFFPVYFNEPHERIDDFGCIWFLCDVIEPSGYVFARQMRTFASLSLPQISF